MRSKQLAALLAVATMALTACGGQSKPASNNPAPAAPAKQETPATAPAGGKIVIGWSNSLSGGTADMGDSARKATEFALAEYKARGGKLANQIEVIYLDDEVKPEKAVQNITRLIKNDKASVIVGPVNTGNINAYRPLLAQNKVPNIVPVATGVPLTWEENKVGEVPFPWVFRTSMADLFQVPTMLKGAQKMGIKKIAILHDTTGYGVFGKDEIERRAKDFGVNIVTIQSFKIGDTDMTTQLQKAKDAGAEAVFVYALAPEIAQTWKSADKIGWYPKFFGSWTFSQPNTYKLAGKDIVKKFEIYMVQSFHPDQSPEAAEFDKKFRAKYGDDVMMVVAAQTFDAMNIIFQALEKVGPDPVKLRDAFETLDGFKGVTAIKSRPWNEKNHEALFEEAMFLGKLLENGKIEKVK